MSEEEHKQVENGDPLLSLSEVTPSNFIILGLSIEEQQYVRSLIGGVYVVDSSTSDRRFCRTSYPQKQAHN